MTPVELLANGFGRIPALVDRATAGLDARQLSASPSEGANSIAWLAWHTARGQDAWVGDLDGSAQLWTADGWRSRFALPLPPEENGFGMSYEDTGLVVAARDLLSEYLRAVTEHTLAYLSVLTEADLDVVVDDARDPVVTRGMQLMSILDDGLQHAGQAGYARGILDRAWRSSDETLLATADRQ